MRAQRLHGAALVLFAASIPLGEGLAYGALGLVAIMVWVRRRELDASRLAHGVTRDVLVGLALWLACGLLALTWAGHGWAKPGELGRWAPLLAIPLVVLSSTGLEPVWIRRGAVAFVAAIVAASCFGLLQFGLNVRPGEWLSRSELWNAGQGRVPGQWDRSAAGGFYFHRLKMGHVLLVGLAVVAGRLGFGRLAPRRWLFEAGLGAVLATTLLFTYTRGALLAAGVAFVTCLPLVGRRLRWAAVALGLLVGLAALGTPSVRARLHTIGGEDASAVRGIVWSQGVRVVADHPFGVGLGNYSAVVSNYYDLASPNFSVRTYPHSVVLASWAETGPIGAAGFLGAWLCLGIAAWRRLRSGGAVDGQVAAGAALFGLVALGVVGLTHDVLYHNAVALAFAGLVGFALSRMDDEAATRGGAP